MPKLGVQHAAIAMAAEHQQVEAVLGGMLAQGAGRVAALLGVQADAGGQRGGDGRTGDLEGLVGVAAARGARARLVRLSF